MIFENIWIDIFIYFKFILTFFDQIVYLCNHIEQPLQD
jgi:hypothetical protein